jgi:nitrogen fixation protein NifU and related proteins
VPKILTFAAGCYHSNMFSPQVLEYFKNARNSGELPNANAVAQVQNPACGDMLELSLKVEEAVIADARFRAKGCVPTIACASRLTEMVQGKQMADALAISRASLIESLGGLPAESHHAAQLSLDALRAALHKLSKK